jgi:hypothetical protein
LEEFEPGGGGKEAPFAGGEDCQNAGRLPPKTLGILRLALAIFGEQEGAEMVLETKGPSRWRAAARKAIDIWAPSLEASVADAIERGYQDGIIFSAKAADSKGQAELARELRATARSSDSEGGA